MIKNLRLANTHRDKTTISTVKTVEIITIDLAIMIDKVQMEVTMDHLIEIKRIPSAMIAETVIVQ